MRDDSLFMWIQPVPWPDTTKLCSGDERGEKKLTERQTVRYAQKPGEKGPFHQRDHSSACVRSGWDSARTPFWVSGASLLLLKGAKRFKMARPLHNSGSRQPRFCKERHSLFRLSAEVNAEVYRREERYKERTEAI